MRNNNSISTPLSVWLAFFGFVLILAIVFFGFGENMRSTIISKEIKEITAASTCDIEEIKVFAFGSSMFRTGIANRFEAPKWLSDSNNFCIERTGFLNLTLASLNRNKKVINAIAATESDIILIESPLIQYKTRSENRFSEGRPRQTIRMMKQFITAKGSFPMDQYPKPFYNANLSSNNLNVPNTINSRKLRDINEVTKFLTKLKGTSPNSKIIVCDIPRPDLIESKLKQRDQESIEEHKQLYKLMKIDYWEFNQPMDQELFFDIVHLNQNGQIVYMNWLINKIDKETKH